MKNLLEIDGLYKRLISEQEGRYRLEKTPEIATNARRTIGEYITFLRTNPVVLAGSLDKKVLAILEDYSNGLSITDLPSTASKSAVILFLDASEKVIIDLSKDDTNREISEIEASLLRRFE